MSNIILISGSPAESSRSSLLLSYASKLLEGRYGATTSLFSVLDFPAEDLIYARYQSPAFDELKSALEEAEGVIVSTPIYKASYTGALKALLDILPQQALKSKSVLPLASGGSIAHLLAIDYALKPVLSVLGASDIHQGVYFADGQLKITPEGLQFEPDLQARFDDSLQRLIVAVETERLAAVA